jgi:hypothetical protein
MPAFSEGCSGCSKPISPSSDSLHCVNSAISFGGYTPCHSSFHCKCFTVKHYGFASVLQPPTFHSDGGLTARPLDCRLRKWICETCMLRSQGIPDSQPRHYHLRMLERFRVLCIWAHHADSTMKTFGTASNKIRSFEAMLGQEVIPKKFPPSCPPKQPLIRVMWLKIHLHLSEDRGGTSSSVGFALQLPSKTPLFPKTKKTSLSTKELWEITMLPAFEAIRSCSPPCASTGFLKHADPATLQWRSFRRGGYQAMRRASVPRTVRHYMMRWNAKNEHRSTTEDMYDDLSPEDTINASSMI